jgi:hypothetical protein
MATIEQYKSGQAAKGVKMAVDMIQSTNGSVLKTTQGKLITDTVKQSKPLRVGEKQTTDYINNADKCAVGERVCKCMYPDAKHSEAIFLDELADAMVDVGKASYVSKEGAISVLKQYPGFPIIVSKVSGKYMEICRTWPEKCVYWNLEKHNARCIERMNRKADVSIATKWENENEDT